MLTTVALLVALATPLDGGIALAVSTPDQNVRHREVVAGLVDALRAHHAFLHPPLAVVDVALCKGALPCVQALATRRGASWLLSVGVAGVGPRDALVSITLIDRSGAVVVEDSTVVKGSADARADGASLAPRLLAVPGLPAAAPLVERASPAALRPLSVPAAALLVGGAVVAGASVVTALGFATSDSPDAAVPVALAGGLLGTACAGVGAALAIGDAL